MLWKDNKLKDLKVVSLGHAPVSLTPFQVDDKHTVLAAGNRATVFFYDSKKNRLVNSPIILKVRIFVCLCSSRQTKQDLNQEISAATRFVTNSFASSLILASPAGLFVGRVKQLDTMHIRSVCPINKIVNFCLPRYQVPFGLDNPRRIAHEASLKAFGVVCTRNKPTRVGDYEPSRSSFQLIDHNSLARWWNHMTKSCETFCKQ
jgi:DNA damage-binding protein 1